MKVQRLLGLGEAAARRVRNQLAAPGFAERAGRNGMVPNGGIAVFFGTGPDNLYQFEQWRRPLERLAEDRAVFVIVDRPDTGDLVLTSSSLPVAFAQGSAALEELVSERDVRVVLYLNQVEPNFRMLRFAAPVHIQIGHGESDKGGSVSNQHKAYDLTFVGGDAGRDRLQRALRGFDAQTRTVGIGRPQLDHDYPGAPDWAEGTGLRVWYAPTWEGDRPSIAYGSLASHGVAIVDALLADEEVRVIYRPHPRTGRAADESRPGRQDHPQQAGLGRRSASGRRGGVRLAVGVRRRLRHRHLGRRVRLAGDRQAAGDHRAGEPRRVPAAVAAAGRSAAAARGRGRLSARSSSVRRRIRGWPNWRTTTSVRWPTGPAAAGLRPRSMRRWQKARSTEQRYKPRKKSASSSGAVNRGGGLVLPSDSALGRPRKSQQTAPASGRQITTVAQAQRGIRRTANRGAWATSTTQ